MKKLVLFLITLLVGGYCAHTFATREEIQEAGIENIRERMDKGQTIADYIFLASKSPFWHRTLKRALEEPKEELNKSYWSKVFDFKTVEEPIDTDWLEEVCRKDVIHVIDYRVAHYKASNESETPRHDRILKLQHYLKQLFDKLEQLEEEKKEHDKEISSRSFIDTLKGVFIKPRDVQQEIVSFERVTLCAYNYLLELLGKQPITSLNNVDKHLLETSLEYPRDTAIHNNNEEIERAHAELVKEEAELKRKRKEFETREKEFEARKQALYNRLQKKDL